MASYLDTSALVKLVVEEAESAALAAWLARGQSMLVTCDLTRAELVRAVRRAAPDRIRQAHLVLESLVMLGLDSALCEEAGRLAPEALRTLDAVHLAAALDLGDDLEAMVTYDRRVAEAADAHGIAVVAPS